MYEIKKLGSQHVIYVGNVIVYRNTTKAECKRWLRETWNDAADETVKTYMEQDKEAAK